MKTGFCPVCGVIRESLPAPAEGTCAYCYNHLMHSECGPCKGWNTYDENGIGPCGTNASVCAVMSKTTI